MKMIKKFFVVILTIMLVASVVGISEQGKIQAASKPGKPNLTVSATKKNGQVKIVIGKTVDADGFAIYMKASGEKKFKKIKTLKKAGTSDNSFVKKDLKSGDYVFKVRAYLKKDGKTIWGDYSVEQKITVSTKENGDTSSQKMDTVKLYSTLRKMVDNGIFKINVIKDSDYIKFGKYDIDGDGKKEELFWKVLQYSDDKTKALVIADVPVCNEPYSDTRGVTTWDKCSLRTWLNNDFYKKAFSKSEKNQIIKTKVKSYDEGEDTKDYLFLLSGEEAEEYKDNLMWEVKTRIDKFLILRKTEDERMYVFSEISGAKEGYTSLYEDCRPQPAFWIKLTSEIIEDNYLTVNISEEDSFENAPWQRLSIEYGGNNGYIYNWQILDYDAKNKKILLYSRDNDKYINIDTIFTKKEVERILETDVVTSYYDYIPPEGKFVFYIYEATLGDVWKKGDSVKKKLFNLSLKQIEKYLPRRCDRRAIGYYNLSDYYCRNGSSNKNIMTVGDEGYCPTSYGIENDRWAMWLKLD